MTSALDKAFTLIRQLQGALGGKTIVRGNVSSAGEPIRGRDSRRQGHGTGLYAISVRHAVQRDADRDDHHGLQHREPAAGRCRWSRRRGFTLATYNTAGTVVDVTFGFIAIGLLTRSGPLPRQHLGSGQLHPPRLHA
jgi:hypothetical protein